MTKHQVLTSEQHGELRVRTDPGADVGDGVMATLTVPSEFRRVQDAFPILFRLDYATDAFSAFALFGFEAGENLFLDGTGWDAAYRPLTLDIQPFLIGRAAPDSDAKQVHVDMDSPRIALGGEGVRVFDEFGRPTPYLDAIAGKLGDLDVGYQDAAPFFAALRRHELIEPLTLDVTLDSGAKHRLVGWHTINEERLAGLDAAALGELHADDHLLPIFMAVASIGRIGDLVRRKSAAVARG